MLKKIGLAAIGALALYFMGGSCCPYAKEKQNASQEGSVFTKEQQDSIVLKRKEIQLEQLQNEKDNLEKRIAETERYIDSCKAVK